MTQKQYITANDFLLDSYRLAKQILDSNFKPNFLVGFWRGGTPVGIAVQEYLLTKGVPTDHIALRTKAYEAIGKMQIEINVDGLDYLIKHANQNDSILLVDDVFDTGLSMQAVIEKYQQEARKNTAHDIRIATVYFKPENNKTKRQPDFFIHQTREWLVFPHELKDLTPEEIKAGKGQEIYDLLYK